MSKQVTSAKSKDVAREMTKGGRHIQGVIDRGVIKDGIVYVTKQYDPKTPENAVKARIKARIDDTEVGAVFKTYSNGKIARILALLKEQKEGSGDRGIAREKNPKSKS